jgi:NADH pyrophosphatase NudC (nudix superfamily)
LLFTLLVRAKYVPQPEAPSPTAHLEQRKAQIYENLRDLQFEYRVGKLSDEDYQKTKVVLQTELAGVLSEIDHLHPEAAPAATPLAAQAAPPPRPPDTTNLCPHCGAKFARAMKFCGECGKEMVP